MRRIISGTIAPPLASMVIRNRISPSRGIQLEASGSHSPVGPIQVVQGAGALIFGCVDAEIRHAKQNGPLIVCLEAQVIRSMARSDRAAYLLNAKEM